MLSFKMLSGRSLLSRSSALQRFYSSKGLFVGNLAWRTGDKDLEACFAPFGDITKARVITEKLTGKSRGFGFVDFADEEAAAKAIAELDGKDLLGRALRIREATGSPTPMSYRNNTYNNDSASYGYNSQNTVRGMAGQHTTSFTNESAPNPLSGETDLSARSRASEERTAQIGNETL